MEWFVIGVIVFFVFGMISKGAEKAKADEEIKQRKERAEKAREAILASGDKELINKLYLMEAGYQEKAASAGRGAQASSGPSALGTAAAVAGGVLVADAVSASVQQAQLEAAFADIQADFEANLDEVSAGLDDLDTDVDDGDFDLDFEL